MMFPPGFHKSASKVSGAAFSLVELLVVLSVISLLTVMSGGGLRSLSGTGLRQGVYDIAALLELARDEAVARQTYVWVGFENGAGEVRAAAAYSVNGSGTDTSPVVWTKLVRIKNTSLIGWTQLKANTRDYSSQIFGSAIAPESVARDGGGSGSPGITFKVATTQFNGNTITFTPQGQAILKGSVDADVGYDP